MAEKNGTNYFRYPSSHNFVSSFMSSESRQYKMYLRSLRIIASTTYFKSSTIPLWHIQPKSFIFQAILSRPINTFITSLTKFQGIQSSCRAQNQAVALSVPTTSSPPRLSPACHVHPRAGRSGLHAGRNPCHALYR